MKRVMSRLFLLLFLIASVYGCGTGALSVSAPTDTPVPADSPAPAATRPLNPTIPPSPTETLVPPGAPPPLLPLASPTQGGGPVTGNPATDGLVAMARADMTRRLSIQDAAISLVNVEEREWPDASLGCAKPGVMYAQVITPGYLIVLSANGKQYEYHTSTRNVILCDR